ncbi:hypothetical protein GQ54DRAFT_310702 [Martensiomyces pterosporus]|nr:hypothetical protein GQ54DRAFT_310702 [Martensiomyces pterosporus]
MIFAQGVLWVALFSVDLLISLLTLCVAVAISIRHPRLLSMAIFQAVFALQAMMVARSITEIVISAVGVHRDASCRIVLFLALVFAILPLYLCDFCIIYLQLVLINSVPFRKKLPLRILSICCVLPATIPQLFVLFLPPRIADIDSYCSYSKLPSRRHFAFDWLVCNIWILLAGVIGMVSMGVTITHIYRTSAKIRKLSEDSSTHGLDNSQKQRMGLANRALVSVVWFPATPIVSLYFTVVFHSVRFAKQREIPWMETLDMVLQFLEPIFIAIAFYASPPVRHVLYRYFSRKAAEHAGVYDKAGSRKHGSQLYSASPNHSPSTQAGTSLDTTIFGDD